MTTIITVSVPLREGPQNCCTVINGPTRAGKSGSTTGWYSAGRMAENAALAADCLPDEAFAALAGELSFHGPDELADGIRQLPPARS